MPEVHIVGELEGAAAFPQNNLFCKWKLITDAQFWELLEGVTEGQTQVDFPEVRTMMCLCKFSHTLSGWRNGNLDTSD